MLYSIDTVPRILYERDNDATTGTAGPAGADGIRRTVNPDGLCVDADGSPSSARDLAGRPGAPLQPGGVRDRLRVPSLHTTCASSPAPNPRPGHHDPDQDLDDGARARFPLAAGDVTVDPGYRGLALPGGLVTPQ